MAVSDTKWEQSISHIKLITECVHTLAFSHYMLRYLTFCSLFQTKVNSPAQEHFVKQIWFVVAESATISAAYCRFQRQPY